MRLRKLAPVLATAVVVAVAIAVAPAARAETDAEKVAARLAGTWDTRDQAIRDPGLRQLRMVFATVPKSRLGLGAPVLYFEEAALATPDEPLRQVFFRVEDEEGTGRVILRVLEPREGASARGKWRDPEDLALFGPGDVRDRPGCTVWLHRRNDWWEGSTEGTGCPFARDGARALTLEVALGPETLAWWERGIGPDGRQVWGPPKAPLLSRRSKVPPTEPIAPRAPAATTPPAPAALTARPPEPSPIAVSTSIEPRRAPSIVVTGIGADRRFGSFELGGLRSRTVTAPAEGRKPERTWTGAPLLSVLKAAGLVTDGLPARRLLAPAVVVATGSDGYTAAFSVEELMDEARGPLVVADPEAGGPFRLVSAWDRIRAVRSLATLELRTLARNRPEE